MNSSDRFYGNLFIIVCSHTARYSKSVWPFFDIMHEMVKNFANFTKKNLYWSLYFLVSLFLCLLKACRKEVLAQVFSSEIIVKLLTKLFCRTYANGCFCLSLTQYPAVNMITKFNKPSYIGA